MVAMEEYKEFFEIFKTKENLDNLFKFLFHCLENDIQIEENRTYNGFCIGCLVRCKKILESITIDKESFCLGDGTRQILETGLKWLCDNREFITKEMENFNVK